MKMIPSGKYYVGAPCYCFSHTKWLKILHASDYFQAPYQERDKIAVAFNTAYGDGYYADTSGKFSFPVDAGLLGVVPVEMADRPIDEIFNATVIDFPKPFECREHNGVIQLGHIRINTNDDAFEDTQADR